MMIVRGVTMRDEKVRGVTMREGKVRTLNKSQ